MMELLEDVGVSPKMMGYWEQTEVRTRNCSQE